MVMYITVNIFFASFFSICWVANWKYLSDCMPKMLLLNFKLYLPYIKSNNIRQLSLLKQLFCLSGCGQRLLSQEGAIPVWVNGCTGVSGSWWKFVLVYWRGGGWWWLWLVILKISSQLPPPLAPFTPLRLCWVVGPPGRSLLWLPCQWNPWQEFSWCLFICRSNGNYCSGRAVKERERTDRRGQLNMYCVWFPVLSNFLALCFKSDTLCQRNNA